MSRHERFLAKLERRCWRLNDQFRAARVVGMDECRRLKFLAKSALLTAAYLGAKNAGGDA